MTKLSTDELTEKASAAKGASHILALASTDRKNRALMAMAHALRAHERAILAANARDCEQVRVQPPKNRPGHSRCKQRQAGLSRR